MDYDQSIVNKLSLKKNVGDLKKLGFFSLQPLPDDDKALPLLLEAAKGKDFFLGLHNFYVITRYNHSHLYAMAVHELSQLILSRASQ